MFAQDAAGQVTLNNCVQCGIYEKLRLRIPMVFRVDASQIPLNSQRVKSDHPTTSLILPDTPNSHPIQ